MENNLIIRLLDPSPQLSEIAQLNELLKTCYSSAKSLADEFAAASESVDATARRVQEGECYLAFVSDHLVGCVILRTKSKVSAPSWYQKPGVASFGRLAVRSDHQNQGIGTALIRFIEARAKRLGCSELALDTSENSHSLISFYESLGFQIVSHHQWSRTSFKSVVLSKKI
ncbi:MAG: GNAT family N-acetyltransferase [Bdellovibrionia bacterium]